MKDTMALLEHIVKIQGVEVGWPRFERLVAVGLLLQLRGVSGSGPAVSTKAGLAHVID